VSSTVSIDFSGRGYDVLIGAGVMGSNRLSELIAGRSVAVVTNSTIAPIWLPRLQPALSSAHQVLNISLPDGESHKTWQTLDLIFDSLLQHRFDRRSMLIALGGGVVGDMTGFAAAVFQRGIDFIQIPTTLLAMVDSSVGGKTAVNHPLGKNMIGAFHQPKLVLADTDTLATLPKRELSAGLAEVIKHGAIADGQYLTEIEQMVSALSRGDLSGIDRLITRSVQIKAEIVVRDEHEKGDRALLNFGHTFGHAIEAGMGYGKWLHGEAVGAGMVMGATLSRELGLIDNANVQRLKSIIADAGLPVLGPAWPHSRYVELMSVDKKAQQSRPVFVLLEQLGKAKTMKVPDKELFATLTECMQPS
jgi:3-dehydroquinate synthase